MAPRLLLTEIRRPEKFILCSIWTEKEVLVVEWDNLSIYKSIELDVKRKYITHKVGISNAWPYFEPVLHAYYVLVLGLDGTLEFLNENLEVVDVFEIDDTIFNPICQFDELRNRFFIVWDLFTIFKFEIDPSSKKFFKNMKRIYSTSDEIVQVGGCWDEETDGEVFRLDLLLRTKYCSTFYFDSIRENKSEELHVEWFPTSKIQEVGSFSQPPKMAVVKDFGTIFVTPKDSFIFSSQSLSMHNVNGKFMKSSVEVGPFPTNNSPSLKVVGIKSATDGQLLKITGMTNCGDYFELKCEYEYNAEKSTVSRTVLNCGTTLLNVGDQIDFFQLFDSNWYAVHSKSAGLYFRSASTAKQDVVPGILKHNSLLHSNISGGLVSDLKSLVFCGGNSKNSGFVEIHRLGFMEDSRIKIQQLSFGSNVKKIWPTADGIYWIDRTNRLFLNEKILEENIDVLIVTSGGDIVRENSQLLSSCAVGEHHYVSVDRMYNVKWSDTGAVLQLPAVTDPTIKPFITYAEDLTIVVSQQTVQIIENRKIVRSFKLRGINSIFSYVLKKYCRQTCQIICDDTGCVHICTLNNRIIAKLQAHSKGLHIINVPASDKVILYRFNTVLLLSLDELSIGSVRFPVAAAAINPDSNDVFLVTSSEGSLYRIQCPTVSEWRLVPIKVSTLLPSLPTKFITLEIEPTFMVGTLITENFDKIRFKSEYHSKIVVVNSISGKIVSSHDFLKEHPNMIVTDIISTNYEAGPHTSAVTNDALFAKRIPYEKCVLASVSYETADEEYENLFLFSIDDSNGVIELQTKYNVDFSVSMLINYYDSTFFAIGEYLQAFKLDYHVKENRFDIQVLSERIELSAVPRNAFLLETPTQGEPITKKRGRHVSSDTIVIESLFKGFQQFEITYNVAKRQCNNSSVSTIDHFSFTLLCINDMDPLFGSTSEFNALKASALSLNTTDSTPLLAVCDTDNTLTILNRNEEEVIVAQIEIPHRVTTIITLKCDYYSKKPCIKTLLDKNVNPLFFINTIYGGCYLVSQALNSLDTLGNSINGITIDEDRDLSVQIGPDIIYPTVFFDSSTNIS
ncbi:HDL139Cp [Eremothecium sinecaudum]|uniref:HDL139Cp n=1 Tax=Eremothecium sinecaudum TaxID=45286 RepID=A0A0X8HSE0_9SACH|nr:HDL139Cp [Eremothecium sinecaudum]AMD20605.1 HDL139Cp [Eremothecium sinecaudum]